MNLEKFVGLIFVILMGLIIFIFVLSPQPKYQDSISYQLAPNARSLTKDDFEMYVVRVNVFENVENANALKKNINNLNDWKEISDLIPEKFRKTPKLKRSGIAAIFSAALELVREGLINISQKKIFDRLLIKVRK